MPTIEDAFRAALGQHQAGRLDAAEMIYRQILEVVPAHAPALHLLGVIALQSARPHEAITLIQRAVAIDASRPGFHSNLGEAHRSLGQLDEAAASYRQAIALAPDFSEAHNNLALALQIQGQFAAARDHFEQALQIVPEYVEAHYNLGRLLLLQGDYQRGWEEYGWRMRMRGHPSQNMQAPQWTGQPDASRRLLLYAEQGLGDTLQFIRYLSLVRARVRNIITMVPRALLPILTSSGFTDLVSQDEPAPAADWQCSLASLPQVFETRVDTIPAAIPYLQSDPGLVAKWQARLATVEGLKVGIAWQGNPAFYSDRFRSIALDEFAPLAEVRGVRLIRLQRKELAEQSTTEGDRIPIVTWDEEVDAEGNAFMDTAAIMASLDLVITSDTSIAHLAGALGLPVWVALSLAPDWRWLLVREDSPWYPTMRLFRQTRLADWSDVFERMTRELAVRSTG
jgi:hypothetical protein